MAAACVSAPDLLSEGEDYGGMSAGPKTRDGIEIIRRAVTKHDTQSTAPCRNHLFVIRFV